MRGPRLPVPNEDTTDSSIDLQPRVLGGGRLPGVPSADAPPRTDGTGRRVVLLRMVGRGGFGEVFEGRLETPGGLTRRVAVKLLRADVVDEDTLGRTIDEAHLLSRLSHPSLVAVEDLLHVDDRIAIVSEYVDGIDLAERMPLPPAVALEVIAKVGEALHAAWSAPGRHGEPLCIVHRDLKPSNIRLGPHGVVKLLDFGIARAGSGERRVKTGSGLLVGSLGYVAPERWIGDGEGHASDVYALGCVLVEALTGQAVYGGLAPVRQLAIAGDHATHDAHVQPRVLASTTEPAIQHLLLRMLDWEPDQRPTALQVAGLARRAGRTLEGEGLLAWSGTIAVGRSDWSTADGTVLTQTDRGFTVSNLQVAQPAAPASSAPAQTASPTATGGRWRSIVLFLTGLVGALAVAGALIGVVGAAGLATWWAGVWGAITPSDPVAQLESPEIVEPAEPESLPDVPPSPSDPTGALVQPATAQPPIARSVVVEPQSAKSPAPTPAVDDAAAVENPAALASVEVPEPPPVALPSPTGTVVVDGGVQRARLRGPSGVVPIGAVPVGVYTLEVGFEPGVWTSEGWAVRVVEGRTVTWRCRQRFRKCVEVP